MHVKFAAVVKHAERATRFLSLDKVGHAGLQPQTSRPQAGLGLLLTRVRLALDRPCLTATSFSSSSYLAMAAHQCSSAPAP